MDRRRLQESLEGSNYQKLTITKALNGYLLTAEISNGHQYTYVFETLEQFMNCADLILNSLEKIYSDCVISGKFGKYATKSEGQGNLS